MLKFAKVLLKGAPHSMCNKDERTEVPRHEMATRPEDYISRVPPPDHWEVQNALERMEHQVVVQPARPINGHTLEVHDDLQDGK